MRKLIFCVCLGLFSPLAHAISFISFDGRTMALGGAGTASGRAGEAVIFNPALLVVPDDKKEDFFVHGYAGARLLDRNNFIGRAENIRDGGETSIDEDLRTMHSLFSAGDLEPEEMRRVTSMSRELLSELESLAQAPLRAAGSWGASVGQSGYQRGFSASYRRYLIVGGRVDISPVDTQRLAQMFDTVDAVANVLEGARSLERLLRETQFDDVIELIERDSAAGRVSDELRSFEDIPSVATVIQAMDELRFSVSELDDYIDMQGLLDAAIAQNSGRSLDDINLGDIEIRDYLRYQISESFLSVLEFSGAEVEELALSGASRLDVIPRLSVGVTFKQQWVDAIGYAQDLRNIDFSAFRESGNRKTFSKTNLDLGLGYDISSQWKAGVVVKNIFPFKVETPYGNRVVVDRIARAAVAYNNGPFSWMLDYDVTRNEPLGFDPDKQYISSGVEWRFWRGNRLRLGYRHNLVDDNGTPSIGLGTGVNGIFADFSITASERSDEYGAALQLGINF